LEIDGVVRADALEELEIGRTAAHEHMLPVVE